MNSVEFTDILDTGVNMSRYIEGQDRQQVTLLPECLNDFIAEDNTVRIVDVFINELDLVGLGFDGARPAATGRPSYWMRTTGLPVSREKPASAQRGAAVCFFAHHPVQVVCEACQNGPHPQGQQTPLQHGSHHAAIVALED